jgi:hypothetical protein
MGDDVSQSGIRPAMADMVNAVLALRQSGQQPMAEALKNLAERVAGCTLPAQSRLEIIENLVLAGQQAQLAPEKRKRGLVKAALLYGKHRMQASEPLNDAWPYFWPCC